MNAAPAWELVLQIVTAAIALLAVIVAPFVQWVITKRQLAAQQRTLDAQIALQRELTEKQIFASVRASNRQAWIDALRHDVASYLNLSQQMGLLRVAGASADPKSDLYNMMIEAGRTFSAIQLRLNPNEDMHKELLYRLEELNSITQSSPESFAEFKASVVEQAQKIFKFEWNRVKRGE